MNKQFWLIVLTLMLVTRAYGANDAESKPGMVKSVNAATITARAPNGESVLVIERTTPKVVGIIPPGWKVVPLEGNKIDSDPIEIRAGLSAVGRRLVSIHWCVSTDSRSAARR